MDYNSYAFAVKCGDKYFAGFKTKQKDDKLTVRFIGKRQLQDDYNFVAIGSLVEAKELCKALASKYCVQPEGNWTVVVINNLSSHFADIGTIWSAAD